MPVLFVLSSMLYTDQSLGLHTRPFTQVSSTGWPFGTTSQLDGHLHGNDRIPSLYEFHAPPPLVHKARIIHLLVFITMLVSRPRKDIENIK